VRPVPIHPGAPNTAEQGWTGAHLTVGLRDVETSRGGLTGRMLDGRYRVGGIIARGGMSTVYRGTDQRLDRPVAIKVMSQQYVSDQAFLARFEREARIAAGLGHPGVVAVYDYGRDGEHVFLVMELVDGGTLRDLLRESAPLSVPVAFSILEPLLAALGTAHAAGQVHRDIKPENVLISAKGEVKIADFGLVRAVTSQTMATGDVILGTVAYLSPEQVATGTADPRSDVYATGIVCWEMLTGRAPFTGDTAMSVAYQHVHHDVPPVTVGAPGVPEALEDLILAATSREPADRPRDAAAFLSAAVGIRARLGLRRVPVPVPHRQPYEPPAARRAPVGSASVGPVPSAALSTAGPVAGPGGTRAVPTMRAVTAEQAPPGPRAQPRTDRPTPQLTPAERRWQRRWVRRLVIVLVLLLLATAAAVSGWWLGSGRFAYAPTVVGLSRTAAETQVRSAGLVPKVSEASDDRVVAGTVAKALPAPGTKLLRGSAVQVVVSTGRPMVPDIAPGTSVTRAAATLRDHALRPSAETRESYHDTVPAGAVVGTDPAAGQRLPTNSEVTLVVSTGPEPVTVPSVAGKTVDDATNKLIVDGFDPQGTRDAFSDRLDPGTVMGTDPPVGTLQPKGSRITVLVAVSKTVPELRGHGAADATAALTAAGFTPHTGAGEFDADVDGGKVIRTEPASGTRIDPKVPDVTLVVSTAVTVPDLTTGSVGDARSTLAGLGLDIDVQSVFGQDSSPVIGQQPEAGSRVQPGSTVLVGAWG
jgi:serine/threonine-protein kinase